MNDRAEFRRVGFTRSAIDPETVPESLHALIPVAERYGSDPKASSRNFSKSDRSLLEFHRTELVEWLDESARRGAPYPQAHSAFSTLRMIADLF